VKIGIVVDGDAESQALKKLTRRIKIAGTQLLGPFYAPMQPKSTPKQIAKSAEKQVVILKRKRADKVVVLVDREDQAGTPGEIAISLEAAFHELGHQQVYVVIKNRKFENWLIADVGAFRQMPRRYKVSSAFEKAVSPDKADSVKDAEALINQIALKVKYHKRHDAAQIAEKQNEAEIGLNSRSFRRFLRLIGHPDYRDQSCKPKPNS
jgi:hypothetical protein